MAGPVVGGRGLLLRPVVVARRPTCRLARVARAGDAVGRRADRGARRGRCRCGGRRPCRRRRQSHQRAAAALLAGRVQARLSVGRDRLAEPVARGRGRVGRQAARRRADRARRPVVGIGPAFVRVVAGQLVDPLHPQRARVRVSLRRRHRYGRRTRARPRRARWLVVARRSRRRGALGRAYACAGRRARWRGWRHGPPSPAGRSAASRLSICQSRSRCHGRPTTVRRSTGDSCAPRAMSASDSESATAARVDPRRPDRPDHSRVEQPAAVLPRARVGGAVPRPSRVDRTRAGLHAGHGRTLGRPRHVRHRGRHPGGGEQRVGRSASGSW